VHFDPMIRPHEVPQPAGPPDAGDCDLPADLVALGEQLRDDAVWLATCYPANANAVEDAVASESSRQKRPWVQIAAAMLVLATGIGIALRKQPPGALPGRVVEDDFARTPRPVLRQPPDTALASTGLTATGLTDRALDAGEAFFFAADRNTAAGLIVPAVLFQNLSGPEQEGLLDLLDEIVPEAIDLSM
jgi:hypothetical protein